MKTITVCCSAYFYQQALSVKQQLEEKGYNVIVPITALRMQDKNDFDVLHVRTWLTNPDEYDKKETLMRGHFDEIEKADAILVLNYEKKGVEGYIGGNVLMEMGLAFFLRKPIYVLNQPPESLPNYEEVMGVRPIILNGSISNINL